MTLNDFQQKALETAVYPLPIIYPSLGLNEEAGEVAGKVKKVLRDNNSDFTPEKRREIAMELGDCLWFIATCANDIGYTLQEIGDMNYEKLCSRKRRGVIGGSGDER